MTQPYAGSDYSGMTTPASNGRVSTPHSAGLIVAGAILFLVAIRLGYRDISISRVSGGLVRG